MNVPLSILWVLVFVSIICLLILSLLTTRKWRISNIIVVPSPKIKCSIPLTDPSKDVSKLECCVVNGDTTNLKYYKQLDMVIGPISNKSDINICSGFCADGVITQNGETTCSSINGLDKYKKCITTVKITDGCIGSLTNPVAYSGSTFYYGVSASDSTCKVTAPC